MFNVIALVTSGLLSVLMITTMSLSLYSMIKDLQEQKEYMKWSKKLYGQPPKRNTKEEIAEFSNRADEFLKNLDSVVMQIKE
jgi:uncharacterized iron-regulated membrane protein